MSDHENRFIDLAIEPIHELENFFRGSFVQIAGGFVGDQDRRIGDNSPRDRDPLFLPAGKLAWIVVHSLSQSDNAQRGFRMGPALLLR